MTFFWFKMVRPIPVNAMEELIRVEKRDKEHLQLPDFPIMDLLEPTMTLAPPLIAPWMRTIAGEFPATAAESWARFVTVVVVPPAPPVVLLPLAIVTTL